jgi:hypothetical protein
MEARSGERSRRSDRLREFWSGNNGFRLMPTQALAVMLPAAALIYLNFDQLSLYENFVAMTSSPPCEKRSCLFEHRAVGVGMLRLRH